MATLAYASPKIPLHPKGAPTGDTAKDEWSHPHGFGFELIKILCLTFSEWFQKKGEPNRHSNFALVKIGHGAAKSDIASTQMRIGRADIEL